MKKVAFVFGVLFWGLAVFLGTFYLTFPSEAISLRLRYIIAERFDGYTAEIGSVSPWWLGLSIDDVKLYREVSPSRSRPMEDEEGEEAPQEGAQLAAIFESVKVRVSPWSLLRRAPYVSGSVALPGGEVAFSVGSAVSGDGDIALSDLVVKAEQLPLEDLLALLPNASASGTGGIDIDIDLHAGSEGMKDATGHLSLTGAGLELSEVALPAVGDLGMSIPIASLSLAAEVNDGHATFADAHIDSEMAKIKLDGELALRDPIGRSTLDTKIVVSDLGGNFASLAGMAMKGAKQEDGTYLYSCYGPIARLTAYSCSEGERRASSARTPRPSSSSGPRSASTETDDSREQRREEIRERLRQRREERERERAAASGQPLPPPDAGEPDVEDPDVEDPDGVEEPEVVEDPEEPIE